MLPGRVRSGASRPSAHQACTNVLTPARLRARTRRAVPASSEPPPHAWLTLGPLGFLIDLTCYKLPNLVVIAVKNGTLKDSISVYLPLINIGLLSLDLIYLPLEQVHYYVLGRYDIFMEIWGLFMEYIKIK